MAETVVLVHTIIPVIDLFARLGTEMLPGVQLVHVLDGPLLERVRQRGRLAAEDAERLAQHTQVAEQIGAAAVLVTCSTVSPCVDDVRPRVRIPLVKIDEAMIARAVEAGRRIGVLATSPTTLEPTRQALLDQAARVGRQIEVERVLVEDALPALNRGDGATHDRLVAAAIRQLAPRVDAIVLAQASMARVLAVMPEAERPVPILSSPHLALERVRELLAGRQGMG
jgi:aspartate/glutamate racemase